jgi:HEPN domain-containing protein
MDNFEKINYWTELSEYDLLTAEAMLETKRYLYVGFMCHQSIEKLLKAVFVKIHNKIPPFTHSLIDLAKQALIYEDFDAAQKDFLDYLQPLNVQARYPTDKERIFLYLNLETCSEIINKTKELSIWIKTRL